MGPPRRPGECDLAVRRHAGAGGLSRARAADAAVYAQARGAAPDGRCRAGYRPGAQFPDRARKRFCDRADADRQRWRDDALSAGRFGDDRAPNQRLSDRRRQQHDAERQEYLVIAKPKPDRGGDPRIEEAADIVRRVHEAERPGPGLGRGPVDDQVGSERNQKAAGQPAKRNAGGRLQRIMRQPDDQPVGRHDRQDQAQHPAWTERHRHPAIQQSADQIGDRARHHDVGLRRRAFHAVARQHEGYVQVGHVCRDEERHHQYIDQDERLHRSALCRGRRGNRPLRGTVASAMGSISKALR